MVIEDNIHIIDSKPRMDQELKSGGQGNKNSFVKNGEIQGFFSADLNQYW